MCVKKASSRRSNNNNNNTFESAFLVTHAHRSKQRVKRHNICCYNFVCVWVCVGPGEAPSTSGSVLALLESLQNAPHLEVHKDMITWILKVNTDVKVYSHFIISLLSV